MEWTQEHVEIIRTMLLDNKPASKIASVLGRSRNAVLGKIHRERNLKDAAALRYQPKSKYAPGKNPNSRRPMKVKPPKPQGNEENIPLPKSTDEWPWVGRPLVKLEAGMCLWSVNDAAVGELHLFCGEPISAHRYCARHTSISEKKVFRQPSGKDHRDYHVNSRRRY